MGVIKFDLISCLVLINNDDSLFSLFKQKYDTNVKLLIEHAKNEELDEGIFNYVNDIFSEVILKRSEYIELYNDIFSDTKKGTTIRRYGKKKILEDIKNNGGKSSEIQKMMLEVNDLKNIVARLNRKGRKQIINNEEVLTKNQCREVVGVIHTIKNKLNKEGIL